MISKETEDNDVLNEDEDVEVWEEVKSRKKDYSERTSYLKQVKRQVHSYTEEVVHLNDTTNDDEVTFLKESTSKEIQQDFPPRRHFNVFSASSQHRFTSTPNSNLDNEFRKVDNGTNKADSTLVVRTTLSPRKPSFGLLRPFLTPLSQVNARKELRGLSRMDSSSVRNRIRTGHLSRSAILRGSLPPPPQYFGIEPKVAPKWAGISYKKGKKPTASEVASTNDDFKAYNQILQQFANDKSSVSKILSSGMELPGFKYFEPQLRKSYLFNKLMRKQPEVKSKPKIDLIDLAEDDGADEVEFLGSEVREPSSPKLQQAISIGVQDISGATPKGLKLDVQRSREVTPKTYGEARNAALPPPSPNVVDIILKKSHAMDDDFVDNIIKRYTQEKGQINKDVERETLKKQLWTERQREFEGMLEERLKKYMKITEVALEGVTVEEEEQLPELTTSMLEVVQNALRKNRSCVLTRSGSGTITGADIQTLADSNWLNDEVINNYMDMLIQRGQSKEYPSIYAFNTFFYPRLSSSGYSSVKRWTKKIDIFKQDMIIVPIHLEIHWALTVIDFRQKTICYYDSMNGRKASILQLMLKYLQEEKMDKKKEVFDTTGWQTKLVQDIPQQRNGYDCGVFSCVFAEHLARGVVKDGSKNSALKYNRCYPPFPFSHDDMAYFRKRMIYEILTGKLLQ